MLNDLLSDCGLSLASSPGSFQFFNVTHRKTGVEKRGEPGNEASLSPHEHSPVLRPVCITGIYRDKSHVPILCMQESPDVDVDTQLLCTFMMIDRGLIVEIHNTF